MLLSKTTKMIACKDYVLNLGFSVETTGISIIQRIKYELLRHLFHLKAPSLTNIYLQKRFLDKFSHSQKCNFSCIVYVISNILQKMKVFICFYSLDFLLNLNCRVHSLQHSNWLWVKKQRFVSFIQTNFYQKIENILLLQPLQWEVWCAMHGWKGERWW